MLNPNFKDLKLKKKKNNVNWLLKCAGATCSLFDNWFMLYFPMKSALEGAEKDKRNDLHGL